MLLICHCYTLDITIPDGSPAQKAIFSSFRIFFLHFLARGVTRPQRCSVGYCRWAVRAPRGAKQGAKQDHPGPKEGKKSVKRAVLSSHESAAANI